MAWPPTSGSTTGYTVDGVTSIRWGSEGLLQGSTALLLPASGYYTVLRFDEKELVEVIKLPQGSGLTASRVRIRDGVHWAITVRDDSRMTAPVVGTFLSIVDAGGMIGNVGLRYSAKVVENDYNTAVKQPGERVLVAEALVLIEGSASSAAV